MQLRDLLETKFKEEIHRAWNFQIPPEQVATRLTEFTMGQFMKLGEISGKDGNNVESGFKGLMDAFTYLMAVLPTCHNVGEMQAKMTIQFGFTKEGKEGHWIIKLQNVESTNVVVFRPVIIAEKYTSVLIKDFTEENPDESSL